MKADVYSRRERQSHLRQQATTSRGTNESEYHTLEEGAWANCQVGILLNASGARIKHLKNIQLEAPEGGEAARGIWSSLHDHAKPQGGYII